MIILIKYSHSWSIRPRILFESLSYLLLFKTGGVSIDQLIRRSPHQYLTMKIMSGLLKLTLDLGMLMLISAYSEAITFQLNSLWDELGIHFGTKSGLWVVFFSKYLGNFLSLIVIKPNVTSTFSKRFQPTEELSIIMNLRLLQNLKVPVGTNFAKGLTFHVSILLSIEKGFQ